MKHLLPAVLALALLAPAAQAQTCAPAAATAQIADTVRAYYAALAADDAAAARALTTPDFYAYDIGKRFDAPGLSEAIRAAHASGVKLDWNLGEIDVHPACDQAWAAWHNKGSVGDAAGTRRMTWLESAVLTWQGGRWRLAFLHSTRAPPP
jgi:ketosteroid isomerase-like protein